METRISTNLTEVSIRWEILTKLQSSKVSKDDTTNNLAIEIIQKQIEPKLLDFVGKKKMFQQKWKIIPVQKSQMRRCGLFVESIILREIYGLFMNNNKKIKDKNK